jgi:hypothetical protein
VLNVECGGQITAEYFSSKWKQTFSATVPVVFPKYINDTWFDDPTEWKLFDSNGIPIVNYGGAIGVQYNPVTISQYALATYQEYLDTENGTYREKFLLQANWLVSNANQKGNFSVWEYKFDWPIYNLTNPWVSSMAQGEGISVLTRAYFLTQNESYLNAAQTALNAFEVEFNQSGVRLTDSDGVWFEEYADQGARKSKVLNGFLFAQLGLYEYYFATNNNQAYRLFCQGTDTLAANLHRYDTGTWSYYDLLGHVASSAYHRLHIEQLGKMYEITHIAIFLEYGQLFERYANRPPSAQHEWRASAYSIPILHIL